MRHYPVVGPALGGGWEVGVGQQADHNTPSSGSRMHCSFHCQGTLVSWQTRVSVREFIPVMLIKQGLLLHLGPGWLGAQGGKDKTEQDAIGLSTLPQIQV